MGARALRGIQASGFALDRSLAGLPDLPPFFRDLVVDARFRAAERVFGTAIARRADIVLLVGDLLGPDLGPGSRGPWFLLEQFRRLESHGIEIVWAEAARDLHDWFRSVASLPRNVTLLSGEATAHLSLRGQTLALHCRSAGSAVPADKGIADWNLVVAPSMTVDAPLAHWADYVAQAGPHRASLSQNAFSSGASQGTGFLEPGAHGCLMFSLGEGPHPRTEFIPTDVVRWIDETVSLAAEITPETVRSQLAHRLREFPAGHSCDAWIVRWRLEREAGGPLPLAVWNGLPAILGELRRDVAEQDLAAWPAAVTIERSPLQGSITAASDDRRLELLWESARQILPAEGGAIDLGPLVGDDVAAAPASLRRIPADAGRSELESLLCAQAARTLAAHSLTALR